MVENLLYTALGIFNYILAHALNILTTNLFSTSGSSLFANIRSIVDSCNDALVGVGTSLLILFTLYDILSSGISLQEIKRPEWFFRTLIRFVIGATLINIGTNLLISIFNIGNSLAITALQQSTSTLTGFSDDINNIKDAMTFAGIWDNTTDLSEVTGLLTFISFCLDSVWMVVEYLIEVVVAISMIIGIVKKALGILITVWSRCFYIYISAMISPIAFSTFASGKTKQFGINFLRKYVGKCLGGLVMTIIIVMMYSFMTSASSIASTLFGDLSTVISAGPALAYMIVMNALITLFDDFLKKSDDFTSSLFGI